MTLRLDMTWDAQDMARLRRNLTRQNAKSGAMPHVMTDPVDAFIWDYGHSILDHASQRSPVDTGKMRRSLRFAWGPWGATVSAKSPAGWVDQGTKPHWPPVKALEGWARRHGMNPFLVARKIALKGTPKTEWFTGAVKEASRELPRRLRRCAAGIEQRWTR